MAEKEKKVKGREDVTIEYLEKATFHKKGDRSVVHRMQADKLISSGKAKEVK